MTQSSKKGLIIITGASRGIGKAIAEVFAQNGYSLSLCARNEKLLKKYSSFLSEKYDVKVHYQAVDVSDKDQVLNYAKQIREKHNKISALINNAGVFIPGTFMDEKPDTLEKLINTNLYSAYYLSKAFLPDFIRQKKGHIINIGSTASIRAFPTGGSYCVSKFALLGFTKALRAELKNFNIKVSAVLPGAVLTDTWKGTKLPAKRFMKSADVAKIVWNIFDTRQGTVIEEVLLRPQFGDV